MERREMNAYWIKFSDGSEACCEGQNDYDARKIAEHVSGKTVDSPTKWEAGPNVRSLPYPASPAVWQFAHPIHGVTPKFCYEPKKCAGRTSCPQRIGCVE
jgi:hypothetical protein